MRYRTFIRSATNFEELSRAHKMEVYRDLTLEEAREYCRKWNTNRSQQQIKKGTKMEFEAQ